MDEILAAAAQVFETHGYAGGTTNRIAERAGVSVGTLYQYFPSKEAMAVALLERHIAETSRNLHEWVGHMVAERHGLREALQDYVRGMLEMHAARPRLQHILLEETPLPERLHQILSSASARRSTPWPACCGSFPRSAARPSTAPGTSSSTRSRA